MKDYNALNQAFVIGGVIFVSLVAIFYTIWNSDKEIKRRKEFLYNNNYKIKRRNSDFDELIEYCGIKQDIKIGSHSCQHCENLIKYNMFNQTIQCAKIEEVIKNRKTID